MKRCLISFFFFVVICQTILVHTKHYVTLDTFEHHFVSHPSLNTRDMPFHGILARPVIIVTCVQSSDVSIRF